MYSLLSRRLSHIRRAVEVRLTTDTRYRHKFQLCEKREAFLVSSHNSRCVTERKMPCIVTQSMVRHREKHSSCRHGTNSARTTSHWLTQRPARQSSHFPHSLTEMWGESANFRSIHVLHEIFKHVILLRTVPNGNIHSCRKYTYNQQSL